MKKLKLDLEKLNLKEGSILNRNQMKLVSGGETCSMMGQFCTTNDNCCNGLSCVNNVCVEEGQGCEVTCGPGYYACCKRNIMVAYCNCRANGTTASCDAGGPGATQCQVDHL